VFFGELGKLREHRATEFVHFHARWNKHGISNVVIIHPRLRATWKPLYSTWRCVTIDHDRNAGFMRVAEPVVIHLINLSFFYRKFKAHGSFIFPKIVFPLLRMRASNAVGWSSKIKGILANVIDTKGTKTWHESSYSAFLGSICSFISPFWPIRWGMRSVEEWITDSLCARHFQQIARSWFSFEHRCKRPSSSGERNVYWFSLLNLDVLVLAFLSCDATPRNSLRPLASNARSFGK